jgi:hypothetical protein
MGRSSSSSWQLLRILILSLVCLGELRADIAVNGDTLTVATANTIATFRGGDLVALANPLTGESYLRSVTTPSLLGMDLIQPTGETLTESDWSLSDDQIASITFSDSVRQIYLQVSIDPDTQEIVIILSAQSGRAGVRGASWGIDGLDLKAGRVILPGLEGSYVDAGSRPGRPTASTSRRGGGRPS